MLCEYGCGQEAIHQFKNGKWCCKKTTNECLGIRNKNSKTKEIKGNIWTIEYIGDEICNFGCGEKANYQFKNGKLCCKKIWQECNGFKEKSRDAKLGDKNPFYKKKHKTETIEIIRQGSTGRENKKYEMFENINGKLCDYGCELIAKYKSTSYEKYCCEEWVAKCPSLKEKNRLKNKDGNKDKQKYDIVDINNKLCDYGCGKIAKYKNINNRYCCSEFPSQCFGLRNQNGYSIEDYIKKYPVFAKEEELRYNPDKLTEEREIQVHCKNHNCENSKEKDGWFTPTGDQLRYRMYSLDKEDGNDGSYLYCSQHCKDTCPLYRSRGKDPFQEPDELPYTPEQYSIWRNQILKQDDYECQKCGSKENLHCHHIQPVKLQPELSLDPNNGIVLCIDCHFKYGHKTGTECSTGNLAKVICKKKMGEINNVEKNTTI